MNERDIVTGKIMAIARTAEIAALIGMLIIAAVFVFAVYFLVGGGGQADVYISREFLDEGVKASFTISQRLVAAGIMLLPDFLGLFALYTARKLFAGYQCGEVFTALAATRLKMIGWALVLLAPVSQVADTIGIYYINSIAQPKQVRINISLEDTHVYAIVFGLLIVVVGYVMYEAVRISDENKRFV